jgi:hypothetical protein
MAGAGWGAGGEGWSCKARGGRGGQAGFLVLQCSPWCRRRRLRCSPRRSRPSAGTAPRSAPPRGRRWRWRWSRTAAGTKDSAGRGGFLVRGSGRGGAQPCQLQLHTRARLSMVIETTCSAAPPCVHMLLPSPPFLAGPAEPPTSESACGLAHSAASAAWQAASEKPFSALQEHQGRGSEAAGQLPGAGAWLLSLLRALLGSLWLPSECSSKRPLATNTCTQRQPPPLPSKAAGHGCGRGLTRCRRARC